jgi:hypothetical protein
MPDPSSVGGLGVVFRISFYIGGTLGKDSLDISPGKIRIGLKYQSDDTSDNRAGKRCSLSGIGAGVDPEASCHQMTNVLVVS